MLYRIWNLYITKYFGNYRMAPKIIIFVCVSNTCRSPMCEYMLREKLRAAGLSGEFIVASRSLTLDYEPEDSPANEQGQLV